MEQDQEDLLERLERVENALSTKHTQPHWRTDSDVSNSSRSEPAPYPSEGQGKNNASGRRFQSNYKGSAMQSEQEKPVQKPEAPEKGAHNDALQRTNSGNQESQSPEEGNSLDRTLERSAFKDRKSEEKSEGEESLRRERGRPSESRGDEHECVEESQSYEKPRASDKVQEKQMEKLRMIDPNNLATKEQVERFQEWAAPSIERIDLFVTEMKKQLDMATTSIDEAASGSDVAKVGGKLEGVERRVGVLEKLLRTVNANNDSLHQRVDSLEGFRHSFREQDVENRLSTVESHWEKAQDELTTVQDSLKAVESSLAECIQQSERAIGQADETRGVCEELSKLKGEIDGKANQRSVEQVMDIAGTASEAAEDARRRLTNKAEWKDVERLRKRLRALEINMPTEGGGHGHNAERNASVCVDSIYGAMHYAVVNSTNRTTELPDGSSSQLYADRGNLPSLERPGFPDSSLAERPESSGAFLPTRPRSAAGVYVNEARHGTTVGSVGTACWVNLNL